MTVKGNRTLLALATLALLTLIVGVAAVSLSPAWAPGWVHEIQALQRELHRQLSTAIRAVKDQGAWAAWTLVGLSFLYGVFHAAGPGHGKMVISTFLVTHESRLGRGLMLSVLSSLAQGATAVIAVELTVAVLGLTFADARTVSGHLEIASYALVATIGLVLAYSGLRGLVRRHGHHHHHVGDGVCASCGHAHGPSAEHMERPVSLTSLAAVIGSIGLRPCTGAILVLLFAHVLGVHWAGIAAVLAMSVGTAITVSGLATLSVYARKGMTRFMALIPNGSGRGAMVFDAIAVGGGVAILLLGAVLLRSALMAASHPLI